MSSVGRPLPRVEDPDLVTGAGRYVADIALPGCLELVFVRSHEAHGRLRAVDLSRARSLPGVVGAYAAADLPGLPSVPNPPGLALPAAMGRPSLARDRVRLVGDPVAVVVAEALGRADDAAELAGVDIDPLAAVVDATEAATDDVTLFDALSNVVSDSTVGEGAEEAVRGSPVVVDLALKNQRLAPTSIEPRGILVVPEAGGRLTVWCSHQAPHRLQFALAKAFGLAPSALRVVVPRVGGAFGAKQQTAPEYLVAV